MNVVFVHPDLGIGGAERLVVDAACAAQRVGHSVHIYTSHCDLSHCFDEVRGLRVSVWGDWLPRSVFGRLQLLCAALRMLYVSLCVLLCHRTAIDVFFVDQLSLCVPLLRLRAPVLFYCHFPDLLLSPPGGLLKRLYRLPLDALEHRTTAAADLLVCNSRFTATVARAVFPSIVAQPAILHPSTFVADESDNKQQQQQEQRSDELLQLVGTKRFFLSLNRFERKKNHGLAVEAFALLDAHLDAMLVVVGGYDERVVENIEVWQELTQLIAQRGLADRVKLVCNISQTRKVEMMRHCLAVIYTPRNEHYGIVPVEAMALGRPVVASNTGGPTETIESGETGFLCADTPDAFAAAMQKLAKDPNVPTRWAWRERDRVRRLFGPRAFEKKLDELLRSLRK